ncbi:hypothetical protein AKJ39_03210 [candidate division MSBL1 archaeon SCGC-AAA259J03]|uniref:Uncharacterized protein n=1 Tax=candidate division MSBL1 archaeon SCGC-AAA259J03 TaxID=1698269 RepID=A0A656YVQ5_9EURY|nr:hypothetical protein AKJ39_03210 [candidate division MSBL1 archaeon SCGC-AAA259J03]
MSEKHGISKVARKNRNTARLVLEGAMGCPTKGKTRSRDAYIFSNPSLSLQGGYFRNSIC